MDSVKEGEEEESGKRELVGRFLSGEREQIDWSGLHIGGYGRVRSFRRPISLAVKQSVRAQAPNRVKCFHCMRYRAPMKAFISL